MEQELVDIVLKRSFIELSKAEKDNLSEWCSNEEEFDQLKQVFLEVERMKEAQQEKVRPETKQSLDALFQQKHKKSPVMRNHSVLSVIYPADKPFHKRPIVRIAAVALICLLALPFFNRESFVDKPLTAQNKTTVSSIKKDTDKQVFKSTISEEVKELPVIKEKVQSQMASPSHMDEVTDFEHHLEAQAPSMAEGGTHPDGIFVGSTAKLSQAVSDVPEALDLLTAAF